MTEEQQLEENLEWHVIYGAPYFLREERKGVYGIVCQTSTIFRNGEFYLVSEFDPNLDDLVLGKDIEEIKPEDTRIGILIRSDNNSDLKIIRGLRHLARLERALYVTFQNTGKKKSCYGTYVNSFKSDLILARFFNRKYDAGIDTHVF